jgi:hypothetical protein
MRRERARGEALPTHAAREALSRNCMSQNGCGMLKSPTFARQGSRARRPHGSQRVHCAKRRSALVRPNIQPSMRQPSHVRQSLGPAVHAPTSHARQCLGSAVRCAMSHARQECCVGVKMLAASSVSQQAARKRNGGAGPFPQGVWPTTKQSRAAQAQTTNASAATHDTHTHDTTRHTVCV